MMSNKSDFFCIEHVCYRYIIYSWAALQLLLRSFWDTLLHMQPPDWNHLANKISHKFSNKKEMYAIICQLPTTLKWKDRPELLEPSERRAENSLEERP